ncbi:hypothetical protein JCM16163A_25970 [Paenibacillus sp. YK5]
MYFSKRDIEPLQQEETAVWACSKEECSCWMRDDFSFEVEPSCPICSSFMIRGTRMLPVLVNIYKR